jgi:hypothetical protein
MFRRASFNIKIQLLKGVYTAFYTASYVHHVSQEETQAECIICADPLGPDYFTCLGCKNKCIHLACIRKWARRATTCPTCRADLPEALCPRPLQNPAQRLRTLQGTNAVLFVLASDQIEAEILGEIHDALHHLRTILEGTGPAPAPGSSVAAPANGVITDYTARIDMELNVIANTIRPRPEA